MARFCFAFALASCALVAACQVAPSLGVPCTRDSECSGGLVCQIGRCRSACATQRDCPVPQLCLRATSGALSCTLSDDPMCDGTPGSCSDGLSCIDGHCINACHAIGDCPAGSACATVGMLARCVRADVDVDAGVPCPGPFCDPPGAVVVDLETVCVVTESRAVWCWGSASGMGNGNVGETCTTDVRCNAVPMPVLTDELGTQPLTDVVSISANDGVFCAVSQGRVWCWGGGYDEALGTSNRDGIYARPVVSDDGSELPRDFEAVTVGATSAIAIGPTLAIGWGLNTHGELLEPVWMLRDPPSLAVSVPRVPRTGRVMLGGAQGCALARDQVGCWGANGDGEAGGPVVGAGSLVTTVTAVPGVPMPIVDFTVGRDHACALTQGGDIWCWGDQGVQGVAPGSLSCPMGSSRYACPAHRVARAGMTYQAFGTAANANAACAIDDSGRVWCWGEDDADIFPGDVPGEPQMIPGLPPVQTMAFSSHVACAIDFDQQVWCWGRNGLGQLGLGMRDDTTHLVPSRVVFPH